MSCASALQIFLAGVEAAKPEKVFPAFFDQNPVLSARLEAIQNSRSKLFVLSLGKAAYLLAVEINQRYPVHSGFIFTKIDHIPKDIDFNLSKRFILREGTHPFPSEGNVEITKEILEWMKLVTNGDLFLVLLSGGGSALLELPSELYTIADIIKANEGFLKSPLSIDQINIERKKFSRVKGGKLLSFLSENVKSITLALSDVISDDPEVIASAPTFPGSDYFIIGNLKNSLKAAKEKAISFGYHCIIFSESWAKDAKQTGADLANYLIDGKWQTELDSFGKLAILIGGEMVASVKAGGVGGRNQEAVLSFAIHIANFELCNFCFLSGGTDGTDGPTSVAGACIDSSSISLMKKMRLEPMEYLEASNSYPILKAIGAHITTGPTGTNVNDLMVLLVHPNGG